MSLLNTAQLKTLLVGTNLVKSEDFDLALKKSQERKVELEEILLEDGLISDRQLAQLAANYLGFPFVRLSQVAIDQEVLNIIPEVVAKKQLIIAFGKDKEGIKLAMANPHNVEVREFIAKKTGEPVQVFLVTPKDIKRTLRLYQKDIQKTFDEMITEQLKLAGKESRKEAPIAKIVDLLVEYAYTNKASDVHIEPEEKRSVVRFRIDGVLHEVLIFPKNLHEQVVARVKVLSKLRTDEHLSAQDGKMQVKLEEENLDIRISIVPIVEGEKVVMRLLSSKSRKLSLPDLGLAGSDLEKVKNSFAKPYGMILDTGPTGSGKTTTVYSILKIVNTREKNIATIENPVEYEIAGINQIQVNPKTNLTFADGLRSILRQDPDIIFVGEIRDEETAGIAINSAMTGHLVLSALHTNNAATTIPRLIDMGIEPFLVASTVNVIIAQRLVRKICEKCRVSEVIKRPELEKLLPHELVEKYFGAKEELRAYKGKGCPVCHETGFSGRVGIFEVLEITGPVRDLITSKADAQEIEKKAIEEGMTTMLEDGLKKVVSGVTTMEEVLRTTKI